MAKGTPSKDKKSGEKGKGKAEETADKGGKVRTDLYFLLLSADLEGWAGTGTGRVKG
jgi:hypothetical protein